MLTSIKQPTSWWSTFVTRCLIRLMMLFRKRAVSEDPFPHDATGTIPTALRQKYSIAITRSSLSLPAEWTDAKHWSPLMINPTSRKTKRTVFYLHGGAFINGMTLPHWFTVARLSRDLEADVAAQTYTLLPHAGIHDVMPKLVEVYRQIHAAAKEKGHEVIVAGDSAGGCLSAALTLALHDQGAELPDQLLLISPVMNADLGRPEVRALQHRDPWLKIDNLGHIGPLWSTGRIDKDEFVALTQTRFQNPTDPKLLTAMKHPYASPILGDWSFYKGAITLSCGTHDILYTDSVDLAKLADQSQLDVTFIQAKGCVHVYPILTALPLPGLLARDSEKGFQLMVQNVLRKSIL